MICSKQRVKRFICLFLSLLMLLNTGVITVFANLAGNITSGAGAHVGNGACAPGDGSGGAHFLQLAAIKNTAKDDANRFNESAFKLGAKPDGKYLGDTTVTLIKDYRNNVDTTSIFNATRLRYATFYPRDGWSNYRPDRIAVNINSGGQIEDWFSPEDDHQVAYSGQPYKTQPYAKSRVEGWWLDKSYWENYQKLVKGEYKDGGLDWSDQSAEMADKYIEHVFGSQGSLLWNEANAVSLQIYAAYANHQDKVNSDFRAYVTPAAHNGDRVATYVLAYYTAVVLESERQHNADYLTNKGGYAWKNEAGRELLKKYWMSRNQDGSDELIILADMAVAGQHDSTSDNAAHVYSYVAALNDAGVNINWESLNGWLKDAYPNMVSDYGDTYSKPIVRQREIKDNQLIRDNSGFGNNVTGRVAWMFHYFSNWRIDRGTGMLKYTGDSTSYWTEPIGWESSLRMVDAKGGVLGPPGVCYMAGYPDGTGGTPTDHPSDGCDNPPCDPDNPNPNAPDVTLKCDPHLKKVDVECAEDNMVTITLKSSVDSSRIDRIYTYFQDTYLSKDANATMQIKYSLDSEVLDGNPGDTNHYNVFSKGAGNFEAMSGNTFLSSQKLKTRDELNNFLNGSASELTLQDTNIKVCDKVTMKYIGSMYVCMNGSGKHEDFRADPKGTELTGNGGCYDIATLYTKETPFYYSDMRHLPVSEIKANNPYSEKYEAMAGVPTTTNLYLGTGATEYMVNVDLKIETTKQNERTFTIKVTENNCYGDNAPCTYTPCPGPQYGDKGQVTHPVHTKSCPYLGSVKADSITDHRNNKHPGTCNYTYIMKQKIDPVTYMNITDEDLWRLVDFQLKGNSKLQAPANITLAPNLGYYSYHTQDDYSNGNGRYRFSVSIDNSDAGHWGNTAKTCSTGTVNSTHDTCKSNACKAINEVVKTLTNNTVTVVSDYVVLETSEGYQNIMYYELTSNNVPLNSYTVSESDFGNHADMSTSNLTFTKEVPAITWPKQPTVEEMWDNNSNAFSKSSDVTRITTTGYNGDYEDVTGKYNNSNRTSGTRICNQNVQWNQPNLKKLEGNTDFQTGVNKRYIKSDINILDSTTPPPERKWSATDSIAPVTNGEWDTGHCTVLYNKDVSFKNSKGKKWTKWEKRQEAPYSEDHDKINNVVIHNPISNRDAVVLSNDEKYDQRYWGELDRPTPPKEDAKCPRNSSCVFSTLTCNISTPHSNSCYKNTNVGYQCGNMPYNKHVHTSNCNNWSYDPTYYVWTYHKKGCTYNGDTITISHSGSPTKQDMINLHGSSHSSCFASAIFTFNYSYGGEAYVLITGNERGFKCTDGVWRTVVADPGNDLNVKIYEGHNIAMIYHNSGCGYGGSEYVNNGWHHLYDLTTNRCLTCGHSCSYTIDGYLDVTALVCNNEPNTHVHVAACNRYENLLVCTDPHHYVNNSEPHDVKDPNNHYPFADTRCYTPCKNDAKHNPPVTITPPGGQPQSTTGTFINIDREFKIYYPDVGDFEQQPRLNGIAECVDEKGLGYKNNTDTDTWLRNKFVIYPFNTIDAANNLWGAGEPIDLLKLPSNNKVYQFECLLANSEHNACAVIFHSIANNAPETYTFDDADSHTNYDRYTNHAARMSVTKKQNIDVVGSIGALTIHDTGDPRFAELFKQPMNNGKWLIPNVVREVDYTLPNKIVADDKDSRNEDATKTGYYHSVYGITDMRTGGKNHPYTKLPLVPYKNPIAELQREEMRPGYNLYMDIETIGNYYGENYKDDPSDVLVPWERGADATGMFTYKMQIKPKYWELNLDTGKYNEVDAYMQSGSTYLPIVLTNKADQTSEYYYYLDWLNESGRRSYSEKEQKGNTKLQTDRSKDYYKLRLPTNDRDVIGSTDRIYLIDLDRTFIGSSFRYGRDMNTGNQYAGTTNDRISEEGDYLLQSQRWHWTLGLPSSTVFVRAGKPCTDANIKALQDTNSVIVCSLDIKVRGTVWTLDYDGTAVNYSDGTGFRIYPDGKIYTPPTDPKTGKPIDDPIVVVYNNKRTSKDDIQTQGTH